MRDGNETHAGPWVYDTQRGGDTTTCRVRHAGLEVAAVYGETPEESEANARLIAAAPEMLELLKNLIDDEPCRHDHHGYCQTHRLEKNCSVKRAREVIAKAEGK